MDNSDAAIRMILAHEGGYVNDPKDPGGPTNKGITIATFRRYIKRSGTVDDLQALTIAQAVTVYKRQYWDAVRADSLPAGVDYAVADFAVNSGPSRAAKYLQNIIGADQDGHVGPDTIAAAQTMDAPQIINRLCDDRLLFMQRIHGGQLWERFGGGWSNRVADVRRVSLVWADAPRRPEAALPAFADHTPPKTKGVALVGLFAALAAFFRGWTR